MATKAKKRSHAQGSLAAADENELRLADELFGGSRSSFKRTRTTQEDLDDDVDNDDDSDLAADDSLREQHLDDDQLFMIDTGYGDGANASEEDDDEDDEQELDEDTDATSEDSEEEEMSRPSKQAVNTKAAPSASSSRRRRPVWTDPSSATLTVTLSGPEAKAEDGSRKGTSKLRRLRETADEVTVSGAEYEARLRKMFEKLHPRPRWASLALRDYEGKNASLASIGALLSSDVGLVNTNRKARKEGTAPLAPHRLEIQRMRNANETQGRHSGDLSSIETLSFHPTTRANLLMTTSKDRRIRIFNIDGKENMMLNTIAVSDLPLRNAQFHPSGTSALLSGPRPFFYTYDMYADVTTKSTPWRADDEAAQERDFTLARFSPQTGARLAMGGRRGVVHLLDWARSGKSGSGSGSGLIGSVRMNAPLAGMSWDATDENRLVTLSTHGSMHAWDMRNLRCQVQRTDAGLFAPCQLESSADAQWWAVGSDNGIVNMYGREAIEAKGSSSSFEARKSIKNIVTTTTSLAFNPTSELLAIASRRKKDTMKLLHLPSLSVYENWPTSDTPLGSVSAVAFSNDSKYLTVGNHRGKVLLYTLHHFTA